MRKLWIFAGVLLFALATPFHDTGTPSETVIASFDFQGVEKELLKESFSIQSEVGVAEMGRIVGLLAYGSDSRIPTIFVHVRSLDGLTIREGVSQYNPEKFQPYGFGYEIEGVPVGQYQIFAATRLENGQVIRAVYNKCSIWEFEMAKWSSETREIVDALPIELHKSFERKAPTYLLEKFPCSREDSVPLTIEVRAGETTHDVSPIDWYWNGEYPELPIPPALPPPQPQDRQIQYLAVFSILF